LRGNSLPPKGLPSTKESEEIKKALNIGLVKDELAKPLPEKLRLIYLVIEWHLAEFKPEECYIGWSGGKDSTLVLFLVRQFASQIPVLFNNTGVEFPQTVEFVHRLAEEWKLNFTELHPEMSFWECVERWGFPPPSRYRFGTPKCCYHLKEKPVIKAIRENGFKASFIGVTAWESWGRRIVAGRLGICHHSKVYGVCRIRPILYLRPDEVWYLTKEFGIPVNPTYTLSKRVGCLPCTGHLGWEEQIARVNPKLYLLIKRKMGEKQYQLPLMPS